MGLEIMVDQALRVKVVKGLGWVWSQKSWVREDVVRGQRAVGDHPTGAKVMYKNRIRGWSTSLKS